MNLFAKMIVAVFAVITITTPAQSQARINKKYQGLLWEISGNGLKSKSYLYGTMHVSNKVAFHLSDSFFVALSKCDMVALELDFNEWMDDFVVMSKAEEEMFFTDGTSRPTSFYKYAFEAGMFSNNDLKLLLKSTPRIINQMLYRNSSAKSDFEEDNYLDIFIYQAGKKQRKTVIGLEKFYTTELLSHQATQPEKMNRKQRDQEKEEREQLRLKLKELKKDSKTEMSFENAYRMGNLDLMDTLELLQGNKRYLKYMLYERNKIMADRMDSIIRNKSMFTGVGAAHLPGKYGVIELLRAKGYTLRPVTVTSKNDIQLKKQIDELHFPVTFTTKYAEDSLFSVKTPGKLYSMSESAPYKSYLCNDMANGSYYHIQRMNHYGRLKGLNQQEILLRIDSLLYENIPGKILSKKEIVSNTGWPGYEIMNKNSKGDHQQYNIYVSPDEIIIFKMNGLNEYLKTGTEAKEFFSSIQFNTRKAGDKTILLPEFGLSASMYNNTLIYTPADKKYMQQALVTSQNTNGGYKMLMVASCNDFSYIEEDTFELNMLSQRFALTSGMKIKSYELLKQGKFSALQNRLIIPGAKADSVAWMRVMINGSQYYMALMVTDKKADAESYFNSISIAVPQHQPGKTVYKDSLMHFSVNLDYANEKFNRLVYQTSNKSSSYSRIIEEESEKESLYLPIQLSRTFYNTSLTESINVFYNKYSMYYQVEDMKEFWKKETSYLKGDSYLKLRTIENTRHNDYETYTCMLTDTNSSRGIMVKYYLKCATLYRIRTIVDTNVLLSPFKKEFFETFVPADTCIGKPLKDDKITEFFFNKIYDSDTTESKRASNIASYVEKNLYERHIPLLINTIENKKFHQLTRETKLQLLGACSKHPTKEMLVFLERYYNSLTDSTQYQLRILNVLAKMKTADATKTFIKLIDQDLPVTPKVNAIEDCFNPYYDSLELARALFPAMIKYTQYKEYKYPIYKLLVSLTEQKLIKPKVYTSYIENIALDANYDLKIYLAGKKNDYDRYGYSDSYSDEGDVYVHSKNFVDFYSGVNQNMVVYAGLLAPFYDKPLPKKFFNRMLNAGGDDDLKVYVNGLLLKNHVMAYDTAWRNYTTSLKYRFVAYRTLERYNALNKFEKQMLDQEKLVPSMLFSKNFSVKKDTFALVKKIQVMEKGKSGYIYVYKSKPKDKKNWKLNISGSHPLTSNTVNESPYVQRTQIAYNGDLLMEKEITSVLRKIRIKDRKRASLSDFETEENDYYFSF